MKSISLTLVATCTLGLVGCASSAKRVSNMTPAAEELQIKSRQAKPVMVAIERKTAKWDTSLVTTEHFKKALCAAIGKSQLFSKIDPAVADGFRLDVTMTQFTRPRPGFTSTTQMSSHWRLTRLPGSEVLFEGDIRTTNTAWGISTTRPRRACEGAARKTIAEGLQRLSEKEIAF